MIGKRYKYIGNPFGFVNRKSIVRTHPIADTYDDLSDEQKAKVQLIKKVITDRIGDCNVLLYGSQVKGYWTDDSDFDIIVMANPPIQDVKYLRDYDYGFKVDISFRKGESFKGILIQ